MRNKAFLFFVFVMHLFSLGNAAAQDSTSHVTVDTSRSQCHSLLGGDLFLIADIYVPMRQQYYTSFKVGWGAEIRVAPVFLGAVLGISDNGGLSSYGDTYFDYLSVYAGTSIYKYRVEIGGAWTINTYRGPSDENYTFLFLGVNRRYGEIAFIEPEIRIMFPVSSRLTYPANNANLFPPEYYEATKHYNLRDLFLGISVKFGIGYN